MTRRRLRELERAREAQQRAQSGQGLEAETGRLTGPVTGDRARRQRDISGRQLLQEELRVPNRSAWQGRVEADGPHRTQQIAPGSATPQVPTASALTRSPSDASARSASPTSPPGPEHEPMTVPTTPATSQAGARPLGAAIPHRSRGRGPDHPGSSSRQLRPEGATSSHRSAGSAEEAHRGGAKRVVEPSATTGAQRVIGVTLGRPRPRGGAAMILAAVVAVAIVVVPVVLTRAGVFRPETPTASGSVAQHVLAADAPLDEVLEVAGRVGALPVVSLKGELKAPPTVLSDLVIEGTGREIVPGEAVLLSVSTFSSQDGANTTGTATGTRIFRGMLDDSVLGQALFDAIIGTPEGSRIVLRSPVSSGDGTSVTEITVVDVLHTVAVGQAQAAAEGQPSLTLAEDGTMSIELNGIPSPARSTATVLVQGDGEQVSASDKVIARYQLVAWPNGEVRASSYGWSAVPGIIDMTDALAGISHHLVDVSVGSRILLALPADQARGDEPMIVVIDVLAIADADQESDSGDMGAPAADPEIVVVPSGSRDQ